MWLAGGRGGTRALNPRRAGTHPAAFGIIQNEPFTLALWMETTRMVPAILSLGPQSPLWEDPDSMRPEDTVPLVCPPALSAPSGREQRTSATSKPI